MPSARKFSRIALASSLLLLAGAAYACSKDSAPDAKVNHVDGSETRFYVTGPAGTRTRRVEVSAAGQVLSTTQVLRDEVFRRIQPGLTASEAFAIIGPPYRKMRFEATKTTAWDYNYRDSWGYDAELSVIVDDAGIVVGKFSSRTGNN